MKYIRLTVEQPILPTGSGLTHYATSWQISSAPDFTVNTNILAQSIEDTVNLLEYLTTLNIADTDVVYVRSMYYFKDAVGGIHNSNWSIVIPLTGTQTNISLSNTIVATPKVLVASVDYTNDAVNGELFIETSPFTMYAGPGAHFYTDWIVTNSNGKILYSRYTDTDNLTSIRIPMEGLEYSPVYNVKVRHTNTTNTTSMYGRATVIHKNKYSDLISIALLTPFVVNRPLYLQIEPKTTNYSYANVYIINSAGVTVKSLTGVTTPLANIDLTGLTVNSTYSMVASLHLTDGTDTEKFTIGNYVAQQNYLVFQDPLVTTYLDKYSATQEIVVNGSTVQNTRELINNTVLLSNNTNSISLYTIRNNMFYYMYTPIQMITANTNDIPYVNIIPLYNGNIVINYQTRGATDTYSYSIFEEYAHNPMVNGFTKINSLTRPYELYSTAVSASAVVTRDNKVYYVPAEELDPVHMTNTDLSLYVLDTNSFTITKLATLPFQALYNVSLAIDANDNIYVYGGSVTPVVTPNADTSYLRENNNIYLYNIANNTFSNIATFPVTVPASMYSLAGYLRGDGKIMMFNNVMAGPSVGNQDTILFDPVTYAITISANDTIDNLPYRTTIERYNGDKYRMSYREVDPQKIFIYPTTTVYTANLTDNTDYPSQTTVLVVPVGETINIESPYRFTSITIQGTSDTNTGYLTWETNGVIRTFKWNDLIVTRDLTLTQAQFSAGNWESVTVLDGVNFTVTS